MESLWDQQWVSMRQFLDSVLCLTRYVTCTFCRVHFITFFNLTVGEIQANISGPSLVYNSPIFNNPKRF